MLNSIVAFETLFVLLLLSHLIFAVGYEDSNIDLTSQFRVFGLNMYPFSGSPN